MAYPIEADIEAAIEDVALALLENRTLPGAEGAWDAFQQVLSHLDSKVLDDAGHTGYVAASRNTDFGAV